MKKIFLFLLLFSIADFSFSQEVVTIKSISIFGNLKTKNEIILRELSFNTVEQYTAEVLQTKIEESTNNLRNLELFNFVVISKTKQSNSVNIRIDITEKWYFWPYPIFEISERNFNTWWGEFSANNYSDVSRLNYGIFFNWENFRGRNELLKFKIRRGFKEHYLFSYQITQIFYV